ncbi:hypothetical protein CCHOA_04370 [Corynebacterium choanae]|uniref:Uncharacterized protein n=1 Tax=Corynebacterium choanae TaxID=1862358 RepID=A0A3G6J686_9CORY|nr:hypothetical protein CCHOA_04370 [Corynebacterium choanae]
MLGGEQRAGKPIAIRHSIHISCIGAPGDNMVLSTFPMVTACTLCCCCNVRNNFQCAVAVDDSSPTDAVATPAARCGAGGGVQGDHSSAVGLTIYTVRIRCHPCRCSNSSPGAIPVVVAAILLPFEGCCENQRFAGRTDAGAECSRIGGTVLGKHKDESCMNSIADGQLHRLVNIVRINMHPNIAYCRLSQADGLTCFEVRQ